MRPLISCLAIVIISFASSTILWGQEEDTAKSETSQPQAVTTGSIDVPVDHLKLLLDPLTKDDLLVEAEAWRDLLKEKVQEISAAEIKSREKKEEVAEAKEEAKDGAPDSEEDQVAAKEAAEDINQEKKDLLETLPTLREEKSALIQRFTVVLDAVDAKGGDTSEYRQYISAVSGIKVDITDANAAWVAIRGWFTSKEGGKKLGIQILKFIIIMFVFWTLAKMVERLVHKAMDGREAMSDLLKRFIDKIARRLVLMIGLLIALATLGVNVGALVALMGGGAFVIGFALQDTLGNFAAGLMLLFYRPFDVGDMVDVGGVSGKVDNVSLVSTTIRTFDNRVTLVPNKQVWGQVITNATATGERRVDMVFGIGYTDDVDKAMEILGRIVSEHELVLDEPESVIKLNELADSSVNFICRPWAKTADYWTVYWDVTKRVKEEFDANGISIPFPQQDVHIHQVEANS